MNEIVVWKSGAVESVKFEAHPGWRGTLRKLSSGKYSLTVVEVDGAGRVVAETRRTEHANRAAALVWARAQ